MHLERFKIKNFPPNHPQTRPFGHHHKPSSLLMLLILTFQTPSSAASALWALAHTMYVFDVFLL